MKRCSKCKIIKSNNEFSPDKRLICGLSSWCKLCNINQTNRVRKNSPWLQIFIGIKQRCNNPNNYDYKWYGGKGIKCYLTYADIKNLWQRDNASNLKHPSIDRIDSSSNYTFDNCRFIEINKNSQRAHEIIIYQFTLDGKFIKKWTSQSIAAKSLKISQTSISYSCTHHIPRCGYIWKKEIICTK